MYFFENTAEIKAARDASRLEEHLDQIWKDDQLICDLASRAFGLSGVFNNEMVFWGADEAYVVGGVDYISFSDPESSSWYAMDARFYNVFSLKHYRGNMNFEVNPFREELVFDRLSYVAWQQDLPKLNPDIDFSQITSHDRIKGISSRCPEGKYPVSDLWAASLTTLEALCAISSPWILETAKSQKNNGYFVLSSSAALWVGMRMLEFALTPRKSLPVARNLRFIHLTAEEAQILINSKHVAVDAMNMLNAERRSV